MDQCDIFVKAVFLALLIAGGSEATTGWFWHVTDFHWDFSYWKEQLSCNGVGPERPGDFGDQWCDAPWRLIEETVSSMKGIAPTVDFVLWTGDSAPHVKTSHLSTEENLGLVENITSLLRSKFPKIPIYATFGNNDYYKAHQFPPHGNEMYNSTYDIWKDWMFNQSSFLKGGYYTVMAAANLRIIALNTNLYYYKDKETQGVRDPAGQFDWLERVLQAAAENGEKVFLTGHIPPGFNTPRGIRWMTSDFNNQFIDILKRHSDVIAALHFGHEHHDCFRLLHDDSGRPVGSLFIAPSVTPWRYRLSDTEISPAHNPGVRLIRYDRATGKQLDIIQYYANLQEVNIKRKFELKHGYNATNLYSIPDLTAESIHDLVNRMEDAESQEFKDYIKWYNTNSTNEDFCDKDCHRFVMCGFRYMDDYSFNTCIHSTNNRAVGIYVVGTLNFMLQQFVLLLVYLMLCRHSDCTCT